MQNPVKEVRVIDRDKYAREAHQQVKNNLILTALDQMVMLLDKKMPVSVALDQNRYIWARAMFKTKPLQDIINTFTLQVKNLVQRELKKNEANVRQFLKLTRQPDQTIGSAKLFIDSINNAENPRESLQGGSPHRSKGSFGRPGHELHTHHDDEHAVNQASPEAEFDIRSLLSEVTSTKKLYILTKKYLVPNGLPESVKPSDEWLRKLAEDQASSLVTHFHKKQAVDRIKASIEAEVERKQFMYRFGESLRTIDGQVGVLDRDCCAMFEGTDESAENMRMPGMLRQFKLLQNVDAQRAQALISSRAKPFVQDWEADEATDHKLTLQCWDDTWSEHRNLEELIMREAKGYQLDMAAMEKCHRFNMDALTRKTSFYIEALELAHNEKTHQLALENEQLQMEAADHESQQLRREANRNTAKTRDLIRKFVDETPGNRQKFNTLFEVKSYLDKLRAEVSGLEDDYERISHEHAAMTSAHDSLLSQKQKLTEENCIKDLYVEQLHNIMIQGSQAHLPRPYLTAELKKQAKTCRNDNLAQKHLEIVESHDVFVRIQDDVKTSKILSIVVNNIHGILLELGLLDSDAETIKKIGTKRFALHTHHLSSIFHMFREANVAEQITKLQASKEELKKFKLQDSAGQADPEPKRQVEDSASSRKLDEQYQRLRTPDFEMSTSTIHDIISKVDIPKQQMSQYNDIDNCNQLVQMINTFTLQDSKDVQRPQIQQKDLIEFLSDSRRFQVDKKKFALLFQDVKGKIDQESVKFGGNQQKIDAFTQQQNQMLGYFFNSIVNVNRLLGGHVTGQLVQSSAVTASRSVQCAIFEPAAAAIAKKELEQRAEEQLKQIAELRDQLNNDKKELNVRQPKLSVRRALIQSEVASLPSRSSERAVESKTEQRPQGQPSITSAGIREELWKMLKHVSAVRKRTASERAKGGGTSIVGSQDLDNILESLKQSGTGFDNLQVFRLRLDDCGFLEQQLQAADGCLPELPELGRSLFGEGSIGQVLVDAIQRQAKEAKNRTMQDQLHQKQEIKKEPSAIPEAVDSFSVQETSLLLEPSRGGQPAASEAKEKQRQSTRKLLVPAPAHRMDGQTQTDPFAPLSRASSQRLDVLKNREPASGADQCSKESAKPSAPVPAVQAQEKLKTQTADEKKGHRSSTEEFEASLQANPGELLRTLYRRIEMDQVLLSDRYEFFPRQKRLDAAKYENTKINYERIDIVVKAILEHSKQASQAAKRTPAASPNKHYLDTVLRLDYSFDQAGLPCSSPGITTRRPIASRVDKSKTLLTNRRHQGKGKHKKPTNLSHLGRANHKDDAIKRAVSYIRSPDGFQAGACGTESRSRTNMVSQVATTQRLSESEARRSRVDGSPGVRPVMDGARRAVSPGDDGPSPLPAALQHDGSEEGVSVRSGPSSGAAGYNKCSQPSSPAKFKSSNASIPAASESPNAKRENRDHLDDFYQYPAHQSKAQKQKVLSKLRAGTQAQQNQDILIPSPDGQRDQQDVLTAAMQVQTVTEQTEQVSCDAPSLTGRSLQAFTEADQSQCSSPKPFISMKMVVVSEGRDPGVHVQHHKKERAAELGLDCQELLGEDMTTNFQERKRNVQSPQLTSNMSQPTSLVSSPNNYRSDRGLITKPGYQNGQKGSSIQSQIQLGARNHSNILQKQPKAQKSGEPPFLVEGRGDIYRVEGVQNGKNPKMKMQSAHPGQHSLQSRRMRNLEFMADQESCVISVDKSVGSPKTVGSASLRQSLATAELRQRLARMDSSGGMAPSSNLYRTVASSSAAVHPQAPGQASPSFAGPASKKPATIQNTTQILSKPNQIWGRSQALRNSARFAQSSPDAQKLQQWHTIKQEAKQTAHIGPTLIAQLANEATNLDPRTTSFFTSQAGAPSQPLSARTLDEKKINFQFSRLHR